MARVNGDPKYKSYRNGYLPDEPVELLRASGVDLSNGGGIQEFQPFQAYLSDYKISVYDGLSPNRLIFSRNSFPDKKLYLLCELDWGHFNVITDMKDGMAKKVCNVCDALYDHTHKCDKACSVYTATPPCTKGQSKHFDTCNRFFISDTCYQNHLTLKVKVS
jgi:hypothetical protein